MEDTGATNAVAGMILDYRAFDTFGESTVLFVAVAAVVMLMKRSMNKKDEAGERLVAQETEIDKKDQNLILKYGAMILVPFVILFGVYVILNGHISPGGGFSGGAIIGGGLMLYALAFGHEKISKVINYRSFTIITGCALLTYAGCKAYSFYTGANHLGGEIPKGIAGAILSGGFILPLNICVGIIVAFNIMDTSIFLFLASKGYIFGRVAPIVQEGVTNVEAYINPVPSGLVLTGIVVSVSVSAFSLALVQRLYKKYKTIYLDEILVLAKKEEE